MAYTPYITVNIKINKYWLNSSGDVSEKINISLNVSMVL